MKCDQCNATMINGIFCHETGCPNSKKKFINGQWMTVYKCNECGTEILEGEQCNCNEAIQETEPNYFFELLDLGVCKKLCAIAESKKEIAILCPNYSINIQSKYEDGEKMDWDWDDFQKALGYWMSVNDYNDLIVDFTETEN